MMSIYRLTPDGTKYKTHFLWHSQTKMNGCDKLATSLLQACSKHARANNVCHRLSVSLHKLAGLFQQDSASLRWLRKPVQAFFGRKLAPALFHRIGLRKFHAKCELDRSENF